MCRVRDTRAARRGAHTHGSLGVGRWGHSAVFHLVVRSSSSAHKNKGFKLKALLSFSVSKFDETRCFQSRVKFAPPCLVDVFRLDDGELVHPHVVEDDGGVVIRRRESRGGERRGHLPRDEHLPARRGVAHRLGDAHRRVGTIMAEALIPFFFF